MRLKKTIQSALQYTETYTKTDVRYLAKGGGWLLGATTITALLSLASATAFANLLPKEVYGIYQYVLATISLLGLLTLPGINTAIGYAAARGADGSFGGAIKTRMRWGTLASAMAIVIALYYSINENAVLGGAFFIAALFLPFWETVGSYVAYLQGKKLFRPMSLYELGAQSITIIAVITTLLLTDNVWFILFAYLGGWTVGRIIFLYNAIRTYPLNSKIEKNLIPYGKHITLMRAAGTISSNIDKFLLWHFLGPIQVAIYTFALIVPQSLVSSLRIINRLAFPKMANRKAEELRKTLPRKILLFAGAAMTVAALYVVAAPYVFAVFFPKYTDAILFSQIATLLIALHPFSLIATSFSAQANVKNMYVHSIGIPVVRIIFMFVLIPLFGIIGAILALISTKVIESILLFVLFLFSQHFLSPRTNRNGGSLP